jgi:signal peptidase I
MKNRSKKKWILIFTIVAVCCVVFILAPFLVRTFVVQAFKIPSGAMKPTLLIGDHILVDKLPKARGNIKRGDIIVFPFPQDPRKDFVKRVIGLPGEVIELRDKEIYLNNGHLKENYVIHTDQTIIPAEVRPRDNLGPIRVPPESVFVLGDNRDESFDSRFWGFVDINGIKGKVTRIYWSWDKEISGVRWDRIGQTVQ